MFSQLVLLMKIKIEQAFPLLVYMKFLISLSFNTCAASAKTPHLTMLSAQISPQKIYIGFTMELPASRILGLVLARTGILQGIRT